MRYSSIYFVVFITCILVSCSAYEPFVASTNFDSSKYINPEKHGGKLAFSIDPTEPNSSNTSFTPITIRGGFKNAIRAHSFRSSLYNSSGGGATIQIYVDSAGTLNQIERIKSTNNTIARSLEKLARRSNYNPAILNGEPVNSYRQMEVYMSTSTRSVRRKY